MLGLFNKQKNNDKLTNRVLEISEYGQKLVLKIEDVQYYLENSRANFMEDAVREAYTQSRNFAMKISELEYKLKEDPKIKRDLLNEFKEVNFKLEVVIDCCKDLIFMPPSYVDGDSFFTVNMKSCEEYVQNVIMFLNNIYNNLLL
ncbi:MAG: hypothetical protein ACRCYE_03250 [Sarcina sp.]